MYPKLTDKSFLKKKPDVHLLSPYKDGVRDSIKVNKTALEILSFCDGTNSIDYMIETLKEKYGEDEKTVRKNVEEFLSPFITSGLVENNHIDNSRCNIVRGSNEIFYPDVLIWEITDYCPLKCRHCYLPKKNNNIFSKNDIEKIFEIIDKSGVYQVQLTGGEALSHPDIDYIIGSLIQRGIILSISTSGMILNDNILNSLRKLKNIYGSFVRVSLDGNETTHNYIRRNESSYKKALDFIKIMKENGIPCQVGTTIVNQTKAELESLTAIVKQAGVCLIEFGLLTIQGNAKENQLNSFLSQKELIEFLKELSDKFTDNTFSVKVPVERPLLKTCGAGCQIIVVKANKDITICPTAEFTLGNLDNISIDDIMKTCGSKFNEITAPNEKICGKCKNQLECSGCISRALILKNTVNKCNWFESQYEYLCQFINE